MKRILKLSLSLALALCMLLPLATSVSADGKVTYSGNSGDFIFTPGSEHSPTDLFDSFKGVMPGDTRTQKVNVVNDADNQVKVMIYLRALGAHEGSEKFLSQMTLTVDATDGERLFKAPPSEKGDLTDWYCLGTFYSGSDVDLDIMLEVPIEMDNEFQNAIGLFDWEFKVEEFPVDPTDPTPGTGDDNNTVLYVCLGLCSLVLIFFIVLFKRRKDEDEEAA